MWSRSEGYEPDLGFDGVSVSLRWSRSAGHESDLGLDGVSVSLSLCHLSKLNLRPKPPPC